MAADEVERPVSGVCEAIPFAVIALGCIAILVLGIPPSTVEHDEVSTPAHAVEAGTIEYGPVARVTWLVIMGAGVLALASLASRSVRGWLFPPPCNAPKTLWSLVELGQAAALAFVLFVLAAQASIHIGADSPWRAVAYLLPQLALLASLAVLVFRQLCTRRGVAGVVKVARAVGISMDDGAANTIRGIVGYLVIIPLAHGSAEVAGALSNALGYEVPTHPVIEDLGSASGPTIVTLVLVAAVVAPLAEELFFRGFLYATIRDRWGVFAGMATSALLFALVHKGLPNQAVTLVMGLLMAGYYERTGSLVAPIVAHGLFNGVQIALVLASS